MVGQTGRIYACFWDKRGELPGQTGRIMNISGTKVGNFSFSTP